MEDEAEDESRATMAIDIEDIFPVGDRDENYQNAGEAARLSRETSRIIEEAELTLEIEINEDCWDL